MSEFLYNKITGCHRMQNIPDDPHQAIEVGKVQCDQLLEPLQATFDRIATSSGYRYIMSSA